MLSAMALPMTGGACWNRPMLQGKELADALRLAIEAKRHTPGFEKLGPTELARVFGVAQGSMSEALNTGRLAKKHIPKLLEYFADVVGPDHWGLPFSKREFDVMLLMRSLPEHMQDLLVKRMSQEVQRRRGDDETTVASFFAPSGSPSRKRNGSTG